MFNEVLYLTMTKEVDYKNFSKVVDLTVKKVKLKNVESLNFVKPKVLTDITKRRWLIHTLRHDCVLRTVFERRMKDVQQVKRCWWTKLNV